MAVAEKKQVQDDLNFNSDRLSTQVRLIALGILALVWALVTNPPAGLALNRRALLAAAGVGILSMLADLIQYAAGYAVSLAVLNALERGDAIGYPRRRILYRIRTVAFWAKQVLVLFATALFFTAVAPAFLR